MKPPKRLKTFVSDTEQIARQSSAAALTPPSRRCLIWRSASAPVRLRLIFHSTVADGATGPKTRAAAPLRRVAGRPPP
jgi:hypothetical protein